MWGGGGGGEGGACNNENNSYKGHQHKYVHIIIFNHSSAKKLFLKNTSSLKL